MNTATKASVTFGKSLLIGAFRAFVLVLMWNWFVSPLFHTGEVSFWQMLGLLWIVQLFVGDTAGDNPVEAMRWQNLFFIVKACVPDHRNEELKEDLKQTTEGVWGEMGVYIFSQLGGYAFTLGLGWLVHTLFIGV